MTVGAAPETRELAWDGLLNVRDLGGFQTLDGRVTQARRFVRSEAPELLSARGMQALREHGIHTILDLRDPLERPAELAPVAGLTRMHVSVLDLSDRDYFGSLPPGTRIHSRYRELLERWAPRFADAFTGLASAPPGGVLIHCQAGRDRTGIITALLLSMAGVEIEAIAADYALSAERLAPHFAGDGTPPPAGIAAAAWLRGSNVSPPEAIRDVLEGLEVRAFLRDAGAAEASLDAVLARLLDP